MSKFNVSLLQYDISWMDKSTNFHKIRSICSTLKNTDLICLPEMFQTGFSVENPEQAEANGGESLEFMHSLATEHNAVVAGSLMFKDDQEVVNRMILMGVNGVLGHYDKRQLFGLSDEGQHFKAGTANTDVQLKKVGCRLAICYDLRFPYVSLNDTGYELLIVAANWPSMRIAHWDALLRARAIENQAYVVGVNRVGIDPKGVEYCGHSSVYSPSGERLLRFTGEEAVQIELDLAELKTYREKLPFIKDIKN